MSRKERIYIQGLPQLIQLKGHNHDFIFIDEKDCDVFLNSLDRALALYSCALHAYSLHVKEFFLLLTPGSKEDLSRLVQHIGRSYVRYFNQKYHRSGALWEGRYNSCLIEPGAYFLLVQQFVDSAGSDKSALSNGSSYPHYTGGEPIARLTAHEEYAKLGKTHADRAAQYRRFMQIPLSAAVSEKIKHSLSQNCVLGTPQYCQQLEMFLHRRVRPRQCGRPRKYYHSQVMDWVWLESQASQLLQRYCYQEIRLPLLEREGELKRIPDFAQGDAGACRITAGHPTLLRREGTLGCLHAIEAHRDLQSTSKLWYLGTMFRLRKDEHAPVEQYQQLGVEAFGYPRVDIELEQFIMQYDFFKSLRLDSHIELKINTLGSAREFAAFRQALRQYYQPFISFFRAQWIDWLADRPEKLLQSSDSLLATLQTRAPEPGRFISVSSQERFTVLTDSLTRAGIPFVVDKTLYPANAYCHTLFEWHSDRLEEGSLLCRGGRYDGCASELLGREIFAFGFAFMLEPLMRLQQLTRKSRLQPRMTDVVIISCSSTGRAYALALGRRLRAAFPQLSIVNDCSEMRITASKRNAERQGGRFIIIVPEDASGGELEIYDNDRHLKQSGSASTLIGMLSQSLNL
ncbi:ATP phosphoribosyltransferase regulatory subunit [Erwinia persicina]|nr:ATP phosphoribosyltransferase regulatory subunit [Erwinia persicina]MBD8216155.1 ATP phosphoribosyltransferase regulatory subunit [Erwinia persicina]